MRGLTHDRAGRAAAFAFALGHRTWEYGGMGAWEHGVTKKCQLYLAMTTTIQRGGRDKGRNGLDMKVWGG